MPCFYASVELFDRAGANQADEGMIYGGETRLFVLEAQDLAAALDMLNSSIAGHDLALMRVLHAGLAEDFDAETIPFDADIGAMVETALETGQICVSDAHVFAPDAGDGAPSGVFALCADLFDPEWADEAEGEYAGHYQLAVIAAPSAGEALAMVLADCAAQDLMLQAIEGLVDAQAFPFDAYEFEFDDDDPIEQVLDEGGLIWSDAYSYPPEAPRKLDS